VRDEILTGIENNEFHVLYQPIMVADGSRMAAVEALVRWNSPSRGPVGPMDFIAIAEQTGVINELGAFVLRQACRDALNWPEISISVNVSGNQLHDPTFPEFVETAVRESGLPFDRLELEIVESAVIYNFEPIEKVLNRLRGLGIKISLDDFGTGFSSLTYLRKLPIDKLKIDKSFIDGVGSVPAAAIIQAVVAMARALGLKITAEGVETKEQQLFLRVCGCNYQQGYLYSRPVSALVIAQMLAIAQTERRGLRRPDPIATTIAGRRAATVTD
jgi:EAL domain-containing protein (putative c-di-GMP-specific phosphodiesterase class I)